MKERWCVTKPEIVSYAKKKEACMQGWSDAEGEDVWVMTQPICKLLKWHFTLISNEMNGLFTGSCCCVGDSVFNRIDFWTKWSLVCFTDKYEIFVSLVVPVSFIHCSFSYSHFCFVAWLNSQITMHNYLDPLAQSSSTFKYIPNGSTHTPSWAINAEYVIKVFNLL